jgi:uncharacterized protein YheU (UPF0270 family)
MEQPPDQPPPVEVPADQLAAETLQAVVEAFVLREGTDYGWQEVSFAAKVSQVLRQLEHGDAQIVFDPATETVDIVPTVRSGTHRL